MNATRDKQCHKPDMNGNSLYIPPIKMVITGGWFIETVLTTLFHLDLSHDPKIRTIPRHICPTLLDKMVMNPFIWGIFEASLGPELLGQVPLDLLGARGNGR